MAIDQRFFDELIDRCDIVEVASAYLPLKRSGGNYSALCPFHNEKTPSFSVSREKQIFKCFGCGEGGNVISFVMKMENLPFLDAVRQLAERVGMDMPENEWDGENVRKERERLMALNREAARYFHETLLSGQGAGARAYLSRRGISQKSIKMFGLGYADDSWDSLIKAMGAKGFENSELERARLAGRGKSGGLYNFFRDRIMFPISDLRRNVVAFGGRVLQGDGEGRKYINSPDTPVYNKSRVLYGMNLAKTSKAGQYILVEGNLDVIALHQAGFDSAVASCGTAFTTDQAKLLGRYTSEVVICFDADAAGQNATRKAIDILKAQNIGVRVLQIPPKRDQDGHVLLDSKGLPMKNDPDDYIRENGASAFAALLERPETDGQYRLGRIRAQYNLELDEQRIAFSREVARYIATLSSPVEGEILARSAAREAAISEESLLTEIERLRRQNAKSRRKKEQQQATASPQNAAQPAARALRYRDPASAKVEEQLLVALLSAPELVEQAMSAVATEDFSSEFLGSIYGKILARHAAGLEVTAAACMIGLEPDETAHLSSLLTAPVAAVADAETVRRCIDRLVLARTKRTGDSTEALRLAFEAKKGDAKNKPVPK